MAGRGNLGATFVGFAVGDVDFLNSEASRVSKYWRLVEYGSVGFAGKFLGGLWSSSLLGGGALVPFGDSRTQQFVPFGRQETEADAKIAAIKALAYLGHHGQLGAPFGTPEEKRAFYFGYKRIREGLTGPTFGQVQQEFQAEDAYAEAVRNFNPVQREREALDQVFGNMGFTRQGGRKSVSFLSQASGSARASTSTGREFVSGLAKNGGNFISGGVLSPRARSLGDRIDQSLRTELTVVNRLLAQALASEAALLIQEKTKRRGVSSGDLVDATLSASNRFPA